jgi:hypothetical protein
MAADPAIPSQGSETPSKGGVDVLAVDRLDVDLADPVPASLDEEVLGRDRTVAR